MAEEREGEEEVIVDAPIVKADEDLGVLGTVPLLTEGLGEVKGEESKEEGEGEAQTLEDEELEGEAKADEASLALRRNYLKQITAFYKERNYYFQGTRNVSEPKKIEFKLQSRLGKQDSPLAQITKKGELVLLDKKSKVIYQITVPSYRDPKQEEHETILKRRQAAIKKAEVAFEVARDSLRALYKIESSSFEEIKEAMRLVHDADLMLQTARFAEKNLTSYYIPLAMLTLDPHDSGRANAGAFTTTSMTLQQRYAVEEIGGTDAVKPGEKMPELILVSYPEGKHGFMSSWFMKEFSYHRRTYSCAFQAIMSEMARKFGNDEEADMIVDEDNPENMVLFWDKLEVGEGEEPITQEKWNERLGKIIMKVNLKKFENLKLATRLADTGNQPIGYVPPENDKDTFQGTGLPFDNEKSYQPLEWIGQNIYGKALEEIRKVIQEKLGPVKEKKKKLAPSKKTVIANTEPEATKPAPEPETEPETEPAPATELFVNAAPIAAKNPEIEEIE